MLQYRYLKSFNLERWHAIMEISPEMAFHVNDLLTKNSTPSPEQKNNLQNFILEIDQAILNADQDISGVKEQILAMQTKIQVIQNRRAQLIQQRRHYSSLLSPVRCLPNEIFGQIFVYATRDCARHVLNLSAVCKLWRDAALSTPVLWSTLELGHHKKIGNLINHIDSLIKRAHSYPLSLIIKRQGSQGFCDPVGFITIARHQWKSITLDSDDRASALPLLDFLGELRSSNLETLESFSLTMGSYDDGSLISDTLRLGYTPKLKTLALSIQHRVNFDMLPFPWSQLTSLTILLWGNSGIALDLLHACVNLEEFIIDGAEHSSAAESKRSIVSKYLRKLHTYTYDNDFLLSLKTPSIQDVAIKGSPYKYFSGPNFYEYFNKNGLTLLKLSIAPSSGKFVQCIPYLRSLVELRLYDNDYDGDGSIKTYETLNSIVVDPGMDPSIIPLPRLKVLEIICHATEQNQRKFMKVVDSRWWSDEEENMRQKEGQRPLSRIRYAVLMNVRTELNMYCKKDVDVFRSQGMKIEYLIPFDGMGKDEFYTSSYYNPDTSLY